jgi:hypothetical protein
MIRPKVSGAFYNLKNVKIRIMGTYLGFRIVALFFGIVGTYQKKIGIVGTYQKNRKKIGIMGTYLYLKIRNCGNLLKKSELWEHIYI